MVIVLCHCCKLCLAEYLSCSVIAKEKCLIHVFPLKLWIFLSQSLIDSFFVVVFFYVFVQVILVQVNPGETFTIRAEDGSLQCIQGQSSTILLRYHINM